MVVRQMVVDAVLLEGRNVREVARYYESRDSPTGVTKEAAMSRVSTYLNFSGQSEEALTYYRDLFATRFIGPILRFRDMPLPGAPELSLEDAGKIMHMEVEIAAGHVLMATDVLASMGQHLRIGNNTTIVVECDDPAEVDRLYAGLAAGVEETAPSVQPWGQYWSTCLDRFGIRWMITTAMGA